MSQSPIPIYSQAETFYVPQFEVYIRGKKAPDNVVQDILQVTYKDNINEIDTFTIEINNWDAEKRMFKFVPPLDAYKNVFDPGATIEIWMGYEKNLRQMMRGQITSLAPTFSDGAAPTLSIGGLNELHQLRTEQHTFPWENRTDTSIAQELCAARPRPGHPGLGIAFDSASKAEPDEAPQPFVFMNNQFDIVFLLERARVHGYEVYLKNVDGKQTLYFGLSESKAVAPVYQLEWGRSLIHFKPTLATSKQVSKVTVRGWNRRTNRPIEATVSLQDLWKEQGLSKTEIARRNQIAQAFGNRTEIVTDKPVHSQADAKQIARGMLDDQSKKMIQGSGATVGLPDLRAGCKLRIIGFGLHTDPSGNLQGAAGDFDGMYYVTETTHTIGSSGYRTDFSARREGSIESQKN